MKLIKRLGGTPFESLLVEVTIDEYEKIRDQNDFVSACLYAGALTSHDGVLGLYPGEVGRFEDIRLVVPAGLDDEREKMMLARLAKLTARQS